jgi:hypothetical protein
MACQDPGDGYEKRERQDQMGNVRVPGSAG